MPDPMTPEAVRRFWSCVDKGSDCWTWRAGLNGDGYGQFQQDGKKYRAHRLAYTLVVGPVPGELVLDHLCRNRACVNPRHLEPVSNRTNVLRGEGLTAQQARQTHCVNGHPFDAKNTRMEGRRRRCRACGAAKQLRYKARKARVR